MTYKYNPKIPKTKGHLTPESGKVPTKSMSNNFKSLEKIVAFGYSSYIQARGQ